MSLMIPWYSGFRSGMQTSRSVNQAFNAPLGFKKSQFNLI